MPTDARYEGDEASGTVRIGRYRVLGELARGGMATVLLARLEGAHRVRKLVAIKRIHPHFCKRRDFVDMFIDEARIATGLTHPNVCAAVELGEADGAYYLVMEHLFGETLSRVIRAVYGTGGAELGAKYWPAYARIVADSAAGLHAAHEATGEDGEPLSVVHRDVSPHNVFVTYEGAVKVTDFGIAKAIGRLSATAPGKIRGKLAYMSPERARASDVDRRADIWALGVVLWELLACRPLFLRRTEADTVLALRQDEVPPPSTIAPGIPQELDAVVARALARDPEARYETARQLAGDLNRLLVHYRKVVSTAELSEWMTAVCADDLLASRTRLRMLVDADGSKMEPMPQSEHDLDDGDTLDIPDPFAGPPGGTSTMTRPDVWATTDGDDADR